jgi:hypothetical protein
MNRGYAVFVFLLLLELQIICSGDNVGQADNAADTDGNGFGINGLFLIIVIAPEFQALAGDDDYSTKYRYQFECH